MSSGPFSTLLKASGDRLDPTGSYVEYRLSELDGTAADPVAFRQLVAASDPLVYSVAVSRVPAPYLKIAFKPSLTEPGSTSVSANAIVANPSSASAAAPNRQDRFVIFVAS